MPSKLDRTRQRCCIRYKVVTWLRLSAELVRQGRTKQSLSHRVPDEANAYQGISLELGNNVILCMTKAKWTPLFHHQSNSP